MGVFNEHMIAHRLVDPLFILVGNRCASQAFGMSNIDFVLENLADAVGTPCVGPGDVHMVVGYPCFLVGVIRGRQNLFFGQNAGDLVGAFAAGAQLEDALDNGGGFLVWDNLFTV